MKIVRNSLLVFALVASWVTSSRADAPEIAISELPATASKTFAQSRPDKWTHVFYVYATSTGSIPLDNVKPRLTAFQSGHAAVDAVGADGKAPSLRALDGDSNVLDLDHPAQLLVTARFLESDTYAASLFISVPGRALFARDFSVQVGAPAATATVAAKQLDPKAFSTSPGGTTITLTIENELDTKTSFEVYPGRLMRRATGATDGDAGVTPEATDKIIDVEPKRTASVEVKLGDLPAGEYSGEVRLFAQGLPPVVLTETIYSRSCFLIALVMILVGVGVTAAVGWYRDHWLASQDLLIALERVRAQLRSILGSLQSDAIRNAWQTLAEEGDSLADDITLEVSDVVTRIKSYASRVAVFVLASRSDAAIALLADAARRDKRKQLDGIITTLTDRNGDAARATELLKAIDTEGTKRIEIFATLDALDAAIEDSAAGGDNELKAALANSVKPPLVSARVAANQGRAQDAQTLLATAQTELVAAGLAAMKRSVAKAPGWANAQTFKPFADQVVAMTATTVEEYAKVRETYVDGLARLIRATAVAKNVSTKQLDDAVATKTGVMAAVSALQAALLPTAVAEALADQQNVSAALGAPPPEIPVVTPRREAASSAVTLSWRGLRTRKLRVELGINAVVLLLAGAAGIKVLWCGNSSWGTPSDWINAVMWGAGARVGADAFVGLRSFGSSLGKS